MTLSPSSQVWNRAALDGGGTSPREGDTALAALLLVHGMVMNGGVGHVFDTLTEDERAAGVLGYYFFGLPQVALLLEKAAGLEEEAREALDSEYGACIPTDSTLQAAFERRLQLSPDLFAPLS